MAVGLGCDAGIVSVWAEADGRAVVWRRVAGELVREEERFRPWVLVDRPVRADGVRCEELAGRDRCGIW
jgi:hypothetical protein